MWFYEASDCLVKRNENLLADEVILVLGAYMGGLVR
jgi:hypothetical protein